MAKKSVLYLGMEMVSPLGIHVYTLDQSSNNYVSVQASLNVW